MNPRFQPVTSSCWIDLQQARLLDTVDLQSADLSSFTTLALHWVLQHTERLSQLKYLDSLARKKVKFLHARANTELLSRQS